LLQQHDLRLAIALAHGSQALADRLQGRRSAPGGGPGKAFDIVGHDRETLGILRRVRQIDDIREVRELDWGWRHKHPGQPDPTREPKRANERATNEASGRKTLRAGETRT